MDDGWGRLLISVRWRPRQNLGRGRPLSMDCVAGEDQHEAGDGRGIKRLEEEDGGNGEEDTPAGWPGMLSGRGAHSVHYWCCCCCAVALFLHAECRSVQKNLCLSLAKPVQAQASTK